MPDAQHNPSLRIRQETPDDIPSVHHVIRLAFGGDEEVELVEKLRRSSLFDPALSLVAEVEDQIVAHILFNHITVRNGSIATPALSLAPLAVLPAWQRHGIGTQLTLRGLDIARNLAHRICFVVGHPTYYPRFGFVPAHPLGLHDPHAGRPEASMVISLANGSLNDLTGNVVYPPEFD